MNTPGPEFSPLVQRYAGHMVEKHKLVHTAFGLLSIHDIAAMLTAFEADLKQEIRKRCEGTGNDEEVTECDRDLPTAADVRGILSVTGCNGGEE